MLPDYPSVRRPFEKKLLRFMRIRTRFHLGPAFSRIRQSYIHEGTGNVIVRPSGEAESTDMRTATAELRVPIEDVVKLTLKDVLTKIDEMAQEMAAQQSRQLFKSLDRITRKSGNVVDGKGQKFNLHLALEAFKKIQIDFDETTGKPRMPTFVVGTSIHEMLLALPESEKREFKEELTKTILRKKEEWRAREASRRLVG